MGFFLQRHAVVSARTSKAVCRFRRLSGLGLRYYRTGLGRWLSRDPLGDIGSLMRRAVEEYLARSLDSRAKRLQDQLRDDSLSKDLVILLAGSTGDETEALRMLLDKNLTVVLSLAGVEDPTFLGNAPVDRIDILGLTFREWLMHLLYVVLEGGSRSPVPIPPPDIPAQASAIGTWATNRQAWVEGDNRNAPLPPPCRTPSR